MEKMDAVGETDVGVVSYEEAIDSVPPMLELRCCDPDSAHRFVNGVA